MLPRLVKPITFPEHQIFFDVHLIHDDSNAFLKLLNAADLRNIHEMLAYSVREPERTFDEVGIVSECALGWKSKATGLPDGFIRFARHVSEIECPFYHEGVPSSAVVVRE